MIPFINGIFSVTRCEFLELAPMLSDSFLLALQKLNGHRQKTQQTNKKYHKKTTSFAASFKEFDLDLLFLMF